MMPPLASRINGIRAIITGLLRAAAVVLLAVGAYLVLKRLLFGAAVVGIGSMLEAHHGVGEEHSFYRGVAMIAVGAALGLLSGRLARWMAPVALEECPRCRYGGVDASTRCSECGLVLSAEGRTAP